MLVSFGTPDGGIGSLEMHAFATSAGLIMMKSNMQGEETFLAGGPRTQTTEGLIAGALNLGNRKNTASEDRPVREGAAIYRPIFRFVTARRYSNTLPVGSRISGRLP